MTEKGSQQPTTGRKGAGPSLNWAAVSGLAGAIAAAVALVAYLVPPGQTGPTATPSSSSSEPVTNSHPPPSPSPEPVTDSHTPSTPESSLESDTSPPPSSSPVERASSSPLAAVRPPGCDEAAAALTAYPRNAGSTRSGQAAVAQQAYSDLMGAGLNAEGVVGAKIRRLAAEFQELGSRLTGMTGGDPNQVIADINTDVAEFNSLCGYV